MKVYNASPLWQREGREYFIFDPDIEHDPEHGPGDLVAVVEVKNINNNAYKIVKVHYSKDGGVDSTLDIRGLTGQEIRNEQVAV